MKERDLRPELTAGPGPCSEHIGDKGSTSIPVPDLSLTRLTAEQLGNILSVLDGLLFDEWIRAHPSLSTVQHAEVFITELCLLSVETKYGVSLQNISDHLQFLVESVSQSACGVFENFLLTQALYLNLMHFFTDCGSCDTDAVLIAKRWTADKLSAEQLFLLDFLGTLTSSLQMRQMVRWCAWVLSEKSEALQLVGVEEDPCVTAMFAATQVLMGKKLDIVLSSGVHVEVRTKEWSDFYKYLGISVTTNVKATGASYGNVYEADIVYGQIQKHKDVHRARNLSHSTDTEDLQGLLAVLCNAVHLQRAEGKWWPRATQMISWCLLALSDTGKLLEMGTGEGKSCVIAMFTVLRVLRGEKVDVVSSSSVLCQRDAEEWNKFYKFFGITADTNTNKTKDEDRKECYRKDVVYGTIEAFAADHLRQTFEMKDVRPDRRYQCIVVDEVDSLLLDQGVQLTYLSSPMVSMQHLNIILAMIWSHVSQYGFLSAGQQTFIRGPPASFFKAIFDSINTEGTEIDDPIDILCIAEEFNIVPEGFTEDFRKSENDDLLRKLRTVSRDAVIHFFHELEQHVPYGFTVYTLDDEGLLCLQKRSRYNDQSIPELAFLVLGEGLCCSLYDSEETLIEPIADLISERIEYTPCSANSEGKVSIPGFLKNLVEKKVSVWVQNAFLAMQLKKGREYVVENDNVCPVDFRSTGIVELNKKWGDGLQQFVEIKHQIKLSTISAVTNYISNISLFEKYRGKIYGTTGTIGSKADTVFLRDLYPDLSACKMPTFNRKKLFEVRGIVRTSAEEWKSEIKRVVVAQISPNSYRDGRAALVICETINKAKEIYDELKSSIPGEIILYCRSDRDSLSKIDKELFPGDVIVATNLAGRGTDIKVSKEVNRNGGLFVILSFLAENQRVELQAFGRTGRKGKPGSAQIIMSTECLQPSFSTSSSLKEAKSRRDRLAAEKVKDMMNDVTELNLREDLFSEYLKTLHDIHENTDDDEKSAVVAVMNDFWGIWLQNKSEDIEQLKRNDLQKSLRADLSLAKSQSQSRLRLVLASITTSSLVISH
ncbi:LOW QUALITY PROTEIN: protein translocase subunit SecA-like [Acanthopagrus schlegelii]